MTSSPKTDSRGGGGGTEGSWKLGKRSPKQSGTLNKANTFFHQTLVQHPLVLKVPVTECNKHQNKLNDLSDLFLHLIYLNLIRMLHSWVHINNKRKEKQQRRLLNFLIPFKPVVDICWRPCHPVGRVKC